jgi:hypothetical protein
MKTSAACTSVAVAAVCLLGAGCSKSSPNAASTGSTTNKTSAKPAASAGISNGSGGGGPTCKQLTFAQVQPLLKEKIISVATMSLNLNGTGQQCGFTGKSSDATGQITVQVLRGSGAAQEYSSELSSETKQIDVPGVGDKASREPEDGEIIALKGNEFCSVSYSSNDDVPGVGPLEEAHGATNNIGENYYDTVAKALGTLCNRIYGSGNTTPDLSSLLSADASASPSDSGSLPSATLPTDIPSS